MFVLYVHMTVNMCLSIFTIGVIVIGTEYTGCYTPGYNVALLRLWYLNSGYICGTLYKAL